MALTEADKNAITLGRVVSVASDFAATANDIRTVFMRPAGENVPMPRIAMEALAKQLVAAGMLVDELVGIIENHQRIIDALRRK